LLLLSIRFLCIVGFQFVERERERERERELNRKLELGVYQKRRAERERDCFDQRRSFFSMCIAKREESYCCCCRCRDDVL
jgi:hypothetical protein